MPGPPPGEQPPATRRPAQRGPEDEPVLPRRGHDESGPGWGDRPEDAHDDANDDERYLRERPPHHEG